jgi:hypothetical protein
MVRLLDAAARGRFALVVTLLGVVSVLTAASLAPTMSTQAVVVLAALATATALMGIHAPVRVPAATLRSLRPPRGQADVPLVLAGRVTDTAHHPVCPRAPGRV